MPSSGKVPGCLTVPIETGVLSYIGQSRSGHQITVDLDAKSTIALPERHPDRNKAANYIRKQSDEFSQNQKGG